MTFEERFERLWDRLVPMIPKVFRGRFANSKELFRQMVKEEFDV